MKRAFSVCGKFRRMLSELIRQIHSKRTIQSTLTGEALDEEKFHVIGFVPADILSFKREVWFSKLEKTQIIAVEEYLSRPRRWA
jgi:hypothetical protein